MKYTDPDGTWVWLAAKAIYGGITGYKEATARGYTGWKAVGYVAASAALETVSLGKVVKKASGVVKAVHGNSKASNKVQHGYEIYNKKTGDVVKTGISVQKLNKNGTSPRAKVNKINKQEGQNKYAARVVKTNIPNRREALSWEKSNASKLYKQGHSMSKHKRPR